MIKLLIAGKRCDEKTREQAHWHLLNIHGPMVYDAPSDAGPMPAKYIQNHVFENFQSTNQAFSSDRDLVTEIWFDDLAHFRAAITTPYYLQTLHPDESNFVDQSTVYKSMVTQSEQRGTEPASASRLFLFMKTAAGCDMVTFEAQRRALLDQVIDIPDIAAFETNTPLADPDGTEPYADSVAIFSFDSRQAASAFEYRLSPALVGAASSFDSSRSFMVLADCYPVSRLKIAVA